MTILLASPADLSFRTLQKEKFTFWEFFLEGVVRRHGEAGFASDCIVGPAALEA
jgi:hypothetical protein